MATSFASALLKREFLNFKLNHVNERLIHVSSALLKVVSGKIKPTPKKNKPVKYEEAFSPPHIGHRKSWNSWNTTTIQGGLRKAETAVDDMFIRKFMSGTFTGMLESEVIIKRQHNIIRIAAIIYPRVPESSLLFLIGYTEELLSHWFHCIVKLELQLIRDPKIMIFKLNEHLHRAALEEETKRKPEVHNRPKDSVASSISGSAPLP